MGGRLARKNASQVVKGDGQLGAVTISLFPEAACFGSAGGRSAMASVQPVSALGRARTSVSIRLTEPVRLAYVAAQRAVVRGCGPPAVHQLG